MLVERLDCDCPVCRLLDTAFPSEGRQLRLPTPPASPADGVAPARQPHPDAPAILNAGVSAPEGRSSRIALTAVTPTARKLP